MEASPRRSRRPPHRRPTRVRASRRRFSWSTDGTKFNDIGAPFTARQGRWVGAKVGLFAMRPSAARAGDQADFDFFRISRP